jgi:hypothetical protein
MRVDLFVACSIILTSAGPVFGDGRFPSVSETVSYECSDCHLAYPPQMLPQRSWRRVMEQITDHFGEELSLDAETHQEVLRYLLDHAADRSKRKEARKFLRGLGPEDAPIRITGTPRWRDKHDEVPDSAWSDERISSRASCEACHTKAESGLYDDDDGLRIPGPNGTWRRWKDD